MNTFRSCWASLLEHIAWKADPAGGIRRPRRPEFRLCAVEIYSRKTLSFNDTAMKANP